MCGRYTREFSWKQVRDFLDLKFPEEMELRPSYNIAPTQQAPVCRLDKQGRRELVTMTWGLKPPWADPGAPGPINARCETAATNALFRGAYEARRCLVPASGFYEWQKTRSGKRPHYIRLLNDPLFCFAGLWERRFEEGKPVETFTILTTDANESVAELHDRMPVILRPADYDAWLGRGDTRPGMLAPFPADEMEIFPVSRRVNTPKNDDQGLVRRDESPPESSLWGPGSGGG